MLTQRLTGLLIQLVYTYKLTTRADLCNKLTQYRGLLTCNHLLDHTPQRLTSLTYVSLLGLHGTTWPSVYLGYYIGSQ